jgi:squalene synthase HpnC
LARAYAACEAHAQAHYENFPVASRLLPGAMRPHVAAVYAFARTADDLADEGDATAAERQAALRRWRAALHAAVADVHDKPMSSGDRQAPDNPILLALAHSIRSLDLPISLFDDLLSAFGQDTMTTRYASWTEVLDYCRRSANPVGRLVLRIAGYRDAALDRSSDALCTALQLANFWQDFGRDWRAGRLYVPRVVMDACGAREDDLTPGSGETLNDAWTEAIGSCVAFADARFEEGRFVCDGVRGRLRLELRLTWLGGRRILQRVDENRRRLLHYRPTLGRVDLPMLLWAAARWGGRRTVSRRAQGAA